MLNMAGVSRKEEVSRPFDDKNDGNINDFEGFEREEIDYLRQGGYDDDDDSGSELEFNDVDSNEDGSDTEESDQRDGWISYNPDAAIKRQSDIPQHAGGDYLRATFNYREEPTALDIFKEFFTDEMIDIMVLQTNLYAKQLLNQSNLPPNALIRRWIDTDAAEMKAFIALRIAMGLAPRIQARDYFSSSSTWWLTEMPNYSRVMSQRRFEALTSCLHFVNNKDKLDRADPAYNPLFNIQPLFEIVVAKWQSAVEPGKHVSINESVTPFRGQVSFRQYLNKNNYRSLRRCGVKAYALCDAVTCYCIKYDIYTGGHYHYDKELGQGCSVVLKLADGMPAGTIFYTDSFYTSPILATKLMQMKMGLVGTVRTNQKSMPLQLKAQPTQDATFVFKDPILAASFKNRSDVCMVSTVHDTGMQERVMHTSADERCRNIGDENGLIQSRTRLPLMACAYNKYARGVDGLDQLVSHNAYRHRSSKWYIKLFNYILDITLINARILLQLHTLTKVSATAFRQALVDQLLEPYLRAKNVDPRCKVAGQCAIPGVISMSRLEGRHWFEHHPNKKRPRCIVCTRDSKRVQSQYFCSTCPNQPTLCLDPCFKRYHTMEQPEFDRPAKQRRVDLPDAVANGPDEEL